MSIGAAAMDVSNLLRSLCNASLYFSLIKQIK
jgi:hypothetical protein